MQLRLKGKYRYHAAMCDAVVDNADALADAVKQAQEICGAYWQMTIKQFLDIANQQPVFDGDISVAQFFWLKGIEGFVDEFKKAEQAVTIPDSYLKQYERDANKVCLPMDMAESMQSFMVDFFHLQSFDAALSYTLYDYHLARKIVFNRSIYQRRCNQLQEEQLKHRKK